MNKIPEYIMMYTIILFKKKKFLLEIFPLNFMVFHANSYIIIIITIMMLQVIAIKAQ